MLRRRVLILGLGSRGPGGDQKSLRLCPQASASVRKASASVRVSRIPGSRKSSKRRTVVTFYAWRSKSFNSHKDREGRCCETKNCRHFWTRFGSSHLKSVNSHRARGGRGRETQHCRHFWTRVGSLHVITVNSHRDRGYRGRETQHCRRFWTGVGSSRIKSAKGHNGHGDRRVVVAKGRTVVIEERGEGWSGEARRGQDESRARREERRGKERAEGRGERRRERQEESGEEEREERREERRGEKMTPDPSFLMGVATGVSSSLRCTCHVSAFGFVDPIMFLDRGLWRFTRGNNPSLWTHIPLPRPPKNELTPDPPDFC